MADLSIIMPVYNVEDFIEPTLESVSQQQFRDIEVVIVDDASTDLTPHIIKKKCSGDKRCRSFSIPHSGKPSIVRNAGIKASKSEFISFLDGDDLYFPDRCLIVTNVLKRFKDVDVVFHDCTIINEVGDTVIDAWLKKHNFLESCRHYLKQIDHRVYLGKRDFYKFLCTDFSALHMSTVTVRRSRLEKETEYFNEDMITGEDVDLWFRLFFDSRCAYIDDVLSAYRERPKSLTRDLEKFYLGTIEAHEKNIKRAEGRLDAAQARKYRHRIANRYLHLGALYLEKGIPAKARECFWKSTILYPSFSGFALIIKTIGA